MVPDQLKPENLMLLMGTNPLPNYVAAKLLCKKRTHLHLVMTPEIKEAGVHIRLVELLGGEPYDDNQYLHIDSTKPNKICSIVEERVKSCEGNWGLNYTGGKKIMAIHAYRGMEKALEKREPAMFTYLDADTLTLIMDPYNGKPSQYFSTILPEPVWLWQLLKLHGKPESTIKKLKWDGDPEVEFYNKPLGEKIHRIPFRPDLCEILKNAWLEEESRDQMGRWHLRELNFDAHHFLLKILENENDGEAQHNARIAIMLTQKYDPLGEFSKNRVQKKENSIYRLDKWSASSLPPVISEQIGISTLEELADQNEQKVGHLAEWLKGPWLEHYVLHQLILISQECSINDYALGVESSVFEPVNLKDDVFESDVIAMQGHRLFYISVTTDESKSLCKNKLFEAYIRAQHLGGEQAEAALVSFYPDPVRLENELRDERHARVRVFGPAHFKNTTSFREELKRWFKRP